MTCKGCHCRLELRPGISGYCDPCYLATRIEKLVFTRYPPCKASELTHFLAKTLGVLEKDTEEFESDRTAGLVDPKGYLVDTSKGAKDRAPGAYEAGIHTGEKNPESSAASSKKEQESNEDEIKEKPSSRRRRRRGERERSRSRSQRKEKRKERGEGSPEKEKERSRSRRREGKKKQEVASPIEEEEVGTEPEPSPEKGRDPERAGLRKVPAKPSARKPLPRRPRTPSRSPPGYRGRSHEGGKKWKGVKHIIRSQTLGYSSKGRSSKGKGKGKWHRR